MQDYKVNEIAFYEKVFGQGWQRKLGKKNQQNLSLFSQVKVEKIEQKWLIIHQKSFFIIFLNF